jgi:hypothetical protein
MAAMMCPDQDGYYLPADPQGFGTSRAEELVKRHLAVR